MSTDLSSWISHGSSTTSLDLHEIRLTFIDLDISIDLHGPFLTSINFHASLRMSMNHGFSSISTDLHISSRISKDLSRWRFINLHRHPKIFTDLHGFPCISMDLNEFAMESLWNSMGLSGSPFTCIDVDGRTWSVREDVTETPKSLA